MRITLLCGGPGPEREVSLIGGRAVAAALREAGHDVHAADISPADLSALDRPADAIFPVLHGTFGEDGTLQAILESRNLPFVGSGSAASRLGMDKAASKQVWQHHGLPTPAWRVVTEPDRPAAPCVVKSVDGGSSIDVHLCRTADAAAAAVDALLAKHGRAMVEAFVEGTEVTVGILGDQPLPPIRIDAKGGWFDYQSKYAAGGAEHRFDLNLPDAVAAEVSALALKAHRAVGCRDLSRVDFIVDRDHRPFLLEINTLPGFTPRSLLPEAAAKIGIDFPALCDRLARAAANRSGIGPSQTRPAGR